VYGHVRKCRLWHYMWNGESRGSQTLFQQYAVCRPLAPCVFKKQHNTWAPLSAGHRPLSSGHQPLSTGPVNCHLLHCGCYHIGEYWRQKQACGRVRTCCMWACAVIQIVTLHVGWREQNQDIICIMCCFFPPLPCTSEATQHLGSPVAGTPLLTWSGQQSSASQRLLPLGEYWGQKHACSRVRTCCMWA
jgi:hypothetical protein